MQKSKVLHQLAEEMAFKATRYAPSAKYPRLKRKADVSSESETGER